MTELCVETLISELEWHVQSHLLLFLELNVIIVERLIGLFCLIKSDQNSLCVDDHVHHLCSEDPYDLVSFQCLEDWFYYLICYLIH